MSLNQGIVGVQNNSDSSTPISQQFDQQGAGLVTELHARYYQQTVRNKVFSVHTQGTSVTTTAALATTFTGLAVGNPTGSGVNLSMIGFSAVQFAVGVAGTIGIMGAAGAIAASLSPQCRNIGSGTATLTTASAGATIATPLLIATFGSVGSVATTGYGVENGIYVDLGGCIIVPPGSFVASYTSTAQTTAFQFGFVWEEVAIIR